MGSNCLDCERPLCIKNKSGRCRSCFAILRAERARQPRKHCSDCNKELSVKNQTGRCHPCSNRWRWANDYNTLRERQVAGIRRKYDSDAEYRERVIRACRRTAQKTSLDPVLKAKRREQWFRVYETCLNTPEGRAKNRKAVKEKSGKTQSEQRFAWCPTEFREEYRRLVRSKRMHAVDARKIIEAKIADREALKHVLSALEHLKRLAPVAILENGYRYGNAILRPSEVVERAKLRGWQPDRWAA